MSTEMMSASAPANTPDSDGTSQDGPEVGRGRARLAAWWTRIHTAHLLPELVHTRQPALAELVEYSKRGDWTTGGEGDVRTAHLAFTYGVAIPVAVVAEVLKWVHQRPARAVVFWPLLFVLATALAQVPYIGALVPTAVDITSWF